MFVPEMDLHLAISFAVPPLCVFDDNRRLNCNLEVFGHLLTSDNYDDSEKKAQCQQLASSRHPTSKSSKVTGGRNGYGAKLTNIFSTKPAAKFRPSSCWR